MIHAMGQLEGLVLNTFLDKTNFRAPLRILYFIKTWSYKGSASTRAGITGPGFTLPSEKKFFKHMKQWFLSYWAQATKESDPREVTNQWDELYNHYPSLLLGERFQATAQGRETQAGQGALKLRRWSWVSKKAPVCRAEYQRGEECT